jgi:hypothetical protein
MSPDYLAFALLAMTPLQPIWQGVCDSPCRRHIVIGTTGSAGAYGAAAGDSDSPGGAGGAATAFAGAQTTDASGSAGRWGRQRRHDFAAQRG